MFRRPVFRKKTAPGPRSEKRNKKRESTGKRGYDWQWQQYRERFAEEYPFCIHCMKPTAQIDHIIPVRQDGDEASGAKDELFWPHWNHQPTCRRCHRMKTAAHDPRLAAERRMILRQLTEEDDGDRRQQLLTITRVWKSWVDLRTGQAVHLEDGTAHTQLTEQQFGRD